MPVLKDINLFAHTVIIHKFNSILGIQCAETSLYIRAQEVGILIRVKNIVLRKLSSVINIEVFFFLIFFLLRYYHEML